MNKIFWFTYFNLDYFSHKKKKVVWLNFASFAYKNGVRSQITGVNLLDDICLLVDWFLQGMPDSVRVLLILTRSLGITQGSFTCVTCQD